MGTRVQAGHVQSARSLHCREIELVKQKSSQPDLLVFGSLSAPRDARVPTASASSASSLHVPGDGGLGRVAR